MDTVTFYTTVSTISFTLLGLWWVVVQSREEWRANPERRQMAYAVSLHFLLPGAMAILALVAPEVGWLWRITFAGAGILGIVGALTVLRTLRADYDTPRFARLIEWVAIPIYALVTVVALAPELVTSIGLDLRPIQVEGILLAILIFFGVEVAWILMVEPRRSTDV